MAAAVDAPDEWNKPSVSTDSPGTSLPDREQNFQSNENNFIDVDITSDTLDPGEKPDNINNSEIFVEGNDIEKSNQQNEPNSPGNDEQVGMFDALSLAFRNLFRWKRRTFGSAKVTPESGSKFLNPETRESSMNANEPKFLNKNEDVIAMQIFKGQYGIDDNKIPQSSNDSNFYESEGGRYYRSYPSKIYSVNSAGNPVPITIEESIHESETSSEDEKSQCSCEENSEVKLRPSSEFKYANFHPKQIALKIWRKTYLPDSVFMFYWLMLVTLAVLYNLWVIPLRASFISDIQAPWQNIWFAFDAISDVIYLVDIFIKFRTQYMKCGIFISRRSALVKYHKKEWTLLLDFISVFPTDLFFIKSINPYYRMNRIVRLYRSYIFYCMMELKTGWPNILRILNLGQFVVIILHYNACIYYAASVSNGYGATLSSWAYPNPVLYPDYATLTRRYTFSFYWSLQQLSSIGMRPLPEENWQFAYTIYLNIAGIALMVYVIGYITTLLLGKNSRKFDFENTMETTREFMKRRKLPKDLRQRVEKFYDYMWKRSEYGHLDENQLLRHLPISVKQEIIYYGNYNALRKLPELSSCDSNILRSLVSKLQRRTYLPGQFVYRSGDAGTEMFIVGDGILQIIRERDGNVSRAGVGDIFGEMNIFDLNKNHRRSSDVISCGYSELFVLTAKDVNETLAQFPRVMNLVMQQAKRNRAMLRRKMSANFYKRHHQERPLISGKFTNHSIFSLNVDETTPSGQNAGNTFGHHGNYNFMPFNNQGDTPDSGVPSSPAQRQISETTTRNISQVVPDDVGMIVRPDLTEKLTHVYQKNLKSLQKSLDDIWINEVMMLKQQLAETEAERDRKAKEINQLRHSKIKETKPMVSMQNDLEDQLAKGNVIRRASSSTENNLSNDENAKTKDLKSPNDDENNIKKTLQSRTKIASRSNTKINRTVLPSVTSTSSV